MRRARYQHCKRGERQQHGGADKGDAQHHEAGAFSRTPRPPLWLAVLSAISSIPKAFSAATSFISESTLPLNDALARLARLHALDCRQRQPGRFGKAALVDAKQRT
jgi:hypothetical protein